MFYPQHVLMLGPLRMFSTKVRIHLHLSKLLALNISRVFNCLFAMFFNTVYF